MARVERTLPVAARWLSPYSICGHISCIPARATLLPSTRRAGGRAARAVQCIRLKVVRKRVWQQRREARMEVRVEVRWSTVARTARLPILPAGSSQHRMRGNPAAAPAVPSRERRGMTTWWEYQ